MRDRAVLVLLALLALVLGHPSAAQSPGSVAGVITDEEGNPLSGAFVVVEGTNLAAITDPDGSYAVTGIAAGDHLLIATYVGYRSQRRDITVVVGGKVTVHLTLSIDPLDLERIVVTGASNPRVKLDSSVAITTKNSEEIEDSAPLSTADLLKVVPGFWVESSGGQSGGNVFPRGLPQDGSYRYLALWEDGLPVFESPELAFANVDTFYRLDRTVDVMEAVRGGSAAIFASNAPGGLVNFVSKTGEGALAGSVGLTVGDYGLFRADFDYGGPMAENWRFNVGGFYRFDSGIRDPDFLSDNGGQLRFNVTRLFDSGYLRFYFKALSEKNIFYLPIPLRNASSPRGIPSVDPNYGTMTSLDAAAAQVVTGQGTLRSLNLRDGVNPEVFSFGVEFYNELDHGWSLKNSARLTDIDLNYNAMFSGPDPMDAVTFGQGKLTEYNASGIGAAAADFRYRFSTSGDAVGDPARLNGNGLALDYGWWSVRKPLQSFTDILQLTRAFTKHDFSVGLYVSRYSADDSWYFNDVLIEARDAPRLLDLDFVDGAGNVVGSATQNGFLRYGSRYVRANNSATVLALFANDEWEINHRWRLDAGIRYEHGSYDGNTELTREVDVSATNPLGDGVPTLADRNVQWGTGRFLPYSFDFGDWAASVGVNYVVGDRMAVYGRASKGFRQPDFEQWYLVSPTAGSIPEGESEQVLQAEAGFKLSSTNLGVSVALFASRLEDVIFLDQVVDDLGMTVTARRLADTQTFGGEAEVVYRISPSWRVDGTLTLERPIYTNFRFPEPLNIADISGLDFDGNRIRRIPEVIFSFKPTFELLRFTAFLNWFHVGDRFADDANNVTLPAYDRVDLGVIYDLPRWRYALQFTNLFNEVGLTEGNPRSGQIVGTVSDLYLARPILGRTIRLSALYRF